MMQIDHVDVRPNAINNSQLKYDKDMCKTANYLPVLGGEVSSVHNESEVEVMGDVVVEGGRGRP